MLNLASRRHIVAARAPTVCVSCSCYAAIAGHSHALAGVIDVRTQKVYQPHRHTHTHTNTLHADWFLQSIEHADNSLDKFL